MLTRETLVLLGEQLLSRGRAMRDLGLPEERSNWDAWRLGSEACLKLYAIEGVSVETAIAEMREEWRETVEASTYPLIKISELDDV
jgi:hypothetical protein